MKKILNNLPLCVVSILSLALLGYATYQYGMTRTNTGLTIVWAVYGGFLWGKWSEARCQMTPSITTVLVTPPFRVPKDDACEKTWRREENGEVFLFLGASNRN